MIGLNQLKILNNSPSFSSFFIFEFDGIFQPFERNRFSQFVQ